MVNAVDRAEHRRGMIAGLSAYTLWGAFPLVFHQLRSVSPSNFTRLYLFRLHKNRQQDDAPISCEPVRDSRLLPQ